MPRHLQKQPNKASYSIFSILAVLALLLPSGLLNAQITVSFSTVEPTCFGLPNGNITATAIGGTAPYNYSWSNGDSGPTITGIPAGTYSVTVVDLFGTNTVAGITLTQPSIVDATLTVDDVCDAPFDITANPFGGIPPYGYNWSTGAMTQTIVNVPAGTYSVTVTDDNACGSVHEITVTANPPSVNVSTNSVTCPGGSDGTLIATPSGGQPPFTYQWSNGQFGQVINNVPAGFYTVTLTDGNGCTDVASGTVTQPPTIFINLNPTNPTCAGDFTGSVTSNISGGTPPYTLSWNTGSSAPNLFNLGPGTYTLTVFDAVGCVQSATTNLNFVSNLTVGGVGTPETCPGFNDGFATVSPQGGVFPYTYMWSNGNTTQVVDNASPGNYGVTVTDAVGCTGTMVIVVPAAPDFIVTATSTSVTTCGINNGTATAVVTAGIGPFIFNWSNGMTGQFISNLGAGTYTVTATNGNNCVTTSTTTITAPPNVFVNTSGSSTVCPGANNGFVTANPIGGTPPFSYAWNSGQNTQTIVNLPPGTYTVTLTDAFGCTATDTQVITQAPGVSFNLTGTTTVCGAGSLGSATATPLSGTGPFTFAWSTGSNAPSIFGLTEGNYSVTVTDLNGCSSSNSIFINIIDDLAVNVVGNDVLCFGEASGSATAFPSGGDAPYSFTWNNGANTQSISNLIPGVYTVLMTDANGCTATNNVTINQPGDLGVIIQPTDPVNCFGEANATLTAVPFSGTPGYSFLWNTGSTGATIANLPAGTYSVTVTDVNECTATASFTVTQTQQIFVNIAAETVVCGAENSGDATAIVTGGTGPFTYMWSNGQISESIGNLGSGSYAVTVTDALGCEGEANISILVISDFSANVLPRDVLCAGGNSGSILVQTTGGTPPYDYNWSNGAGNSNEIIDLTTGTYSVTITDFNGCTIIETVNIGEPSALDASLTSDNPDCNGDETGSIVVNAFGGTPPYTYAWNNGGSGNTQNNLSAGFYSVTVTDANLCTIFRNITLTHPDFLNVSINSPTIECGGTATGFATAMPTGGTPPYAYQWSDGQNTQTAVALTAGTYSVTVTDANGCIREIPSVILNELPAMQVTFDANNIACSSSPIGSITANPTLGTAPYTYQWNTGQTTQTISNLFAGTYTVTVTDANDCKITASGTITQTNGFTSFATPTAVSCFGGSDGSITVTNNGGTAPFSYVWNFGPGSQTVSGLSPGVYDVTITDANNCTATATTIVGEPIELSVSTSGTDIDCAGSNDGMATATPSGGTPPYSYQWSNGDQTQTATMLGVGTHFVTVTDSQECTTTSSVAISAPGSLNVNITQNSGTCNNTGDGILVANVFGGTMPYSYMWSNGTTTQTASNLTGGPYSVTVTDANGCTNSATASVTVFPVPSCNITIDQESTLGNNGQLTVNGSGGVEPYTYMWNTGASTETISNLAPGTYTVTITDNNGCQSTCNSTLELLAGIGNFVWEDIDHDGQQDATEPVIPGVTVHLKDENGNIISTTMTDANGEYYFLGLDAGTYSVLFEIPVGMDYTASNMGDDALDSDIVAGMNGMTGQYVLDPGELDFTVDAGLYVPPNGFANDPCFCLNNSTNDLNGQFLEEFVVTSYPGETWTVLSGQNMFALNSADPPVPPTPISFPDVMTETSPGMYNFPFLLVDEFTYVITVTNGFDTLSLTNTCTYPNLNLDEVPSFDLCIIDDPIILMANPSVPGTITYLLNGNPVTVIDPLVLGVGNYELVIMLVPDDPDLCEVSSVTTFVINQDCAAGIGNYVWEDIDHDGQQDNNEPPIPDVVVHLKDAGGTIIATTMTDANGEYYFNNILPGTYSILFEIPAGMDYTASNMGDDALDSDIVAGMNGMTGQYTLNAGDFDYTVDAGLYVPPNGVIGDPCSCLNNSTNEINGQFTETFTIHSYPNETWTVFDGEGMFLFSSMEPPTDPIPVTYPFDMDELVAEPGTYEYTFRLVHDTQYTVYATNGFDTLSISNICHYPTVNVTELPPVELCLVDAPIQLGANPSIPGNMIFTIDGMVVTELDPADLGTGDYELIATFVPVDPEECEANIITQFEVFDDCQAEVGDLVWVDYDCDGIQDAGEPGIPNIMVIISGTPIEEFDTPPFSDTTFTNSAGEYYFMVPPGEYKITFPGLGTSDLSPINQGGNDTVDSDVDPNTLMTEMFTLEAYEQNFTFDVGICPECINIEYPGAISGDQYLCAPGNDPDEIISLAPASGGQGTPEYLWMMTTGDPNIGIQFWTPIPNSNTLSYDPGPLFETTYFARCARNEGCGVYLETSVVTIIVGDEATAEILGPNLACFNELTTYQAVGISGSADIVWNFSGNVTPSTATGASVNAVWHTFGVFEVELMVTQDGCTAYDYQTVTVTNSPTLCNSGLQIGGDVTDEAIGAVKVNWEMPSYVQGLVYHVEHSADNETFARMTTVTEHDNQLNGINYFLYEGIAPKKGRNFYRVQAEDEQGNTVYSNVVELIIYTTSRVAMLYPNPVEDELTLEIFDTFNESGALEVFNTAGQLLQTAKIDAGVSTQHFSFGEYPAGVYYIRLRVGDTNVKTMKVVKQ